MSSIPVIYVVGPFRGPNAWVIEQNIRRAEEAALEIWRMGGAALCSHCNTRFFQGAAPDEVWLKGDLEMLRRCDAVYLCPGWENSTGSRAEHLFAGENKIPCFESLNYLRNWIEDYKHRRREEAEMADAGVYT